MVSKHLILTWYTRLKVLVCDPAIVQMTMAAAIALCAVTTLVTVQ